MSAECQSIHVLGSCCEGETVLDDLSTLGFSFRWSLDDWDPEELNQMLDFIYMLFGCIVGVSQVFDGKATLHFLCPSKYNVGSSVFKRTLEKHVHYRMAYPNGWLSDVQTLNVNC